MVTESLIQVKNLYYKYEGKDDVSKNEYVLNGINLDIKKGEFIALIGRNGSGKSTLAKHLNSVCLPSKGDVFVDGINTKDDKFLYKIRTKVGQVFQNPDNQIVASIVEDDVAFGCENLGIPPDEIRFRVNKALTAVDMCGYEKHSVNTLSGGQKQRVAIAGIIAMEPDCIILDEPTSMLDPKGREEVISTVMKLNREKKITVILITHNMEEAVSADRVIVMGSGKIILDGTPQNVFSKIETLNEYELNVPQASELIYRLGQKGFDVPECILNEEDCVNALLKTMQD